MALPDDVLSTIVVSAPLVGARAQSISARLDKEDGGIALNDPSEGHRYQEWRAWIAQGNSDIYIEADNLAPQILYSGTNITEVSLSFDQNMRPAIAFVENGVGSLRWYDTQAAEQTVTTYPGITTPRIILDDKRVWQTATNDLIFAYIKSGGLYYRQQRDRFTIEYQLLATLPVGMTQLNKLAFGANYRLHFVLLSDPYVPAP
jgi:hypothetical protein